MNTNLFWNFGFYEFFLEINLAHPAVCTYSMKLKSSQLEDIDLTLLVKKYATFEIKRRNKPLSIFQKQLAS